MCSNIIDAVGNFLKTAVACVCFLLIGGPVLIIFGSLFLKQGDGLEEFKAAVNGFDATPIKAWTGTINGRPANVTRISLNVEGVSGATSVFTEANVPLAGGSLSALSFTMNINTVQEFTRTVSRRVKQFRAVKCSLSSCSSSSRPCNCVTIVSNFQSNCISSGGTFTPTTDTCGINNRCGTCTQHKYLSGFAIYDFGELANVYQTVEPSSVVVRLYSAKDPFIALQRLTRGTGDFGVNRRTVGIVMIVLGVLLLLLEVGACVALICYCVRRKSKPTPSSYGQPTTSNQAATDSPGYVAPNEYGQPPPPPQGYVYGQPQQPQSFGYGQPPPPVAPQSYGYGQPPVAPQGYGYGQPPVAPQGYGYGQPPVAPQGYGYGQPPPA
ncbi:hypothetical protein LSM04_006185 [Trypanosoma melophagium]|uniref:uncharacterized protein n=1 Tax=Trypanosoma melophagium TaxID=715481 RepID=UPI00351A153D|nr:hypothetical protein LSM04_006185 [Trypanosoma melophagium]